jgi:hypothetical protein
MKITFDKAFAKDILRVFGNTIDADGYIISDKTGERVLSQDGEEVRFTEFAGIVPGSQIFIKSDIVSLIKYLEWTKKNGSTRLA